MPFEEINTLLDTSIKKKYKRNLPPLFLGGWKTVRPKEELTSLLQKLGNDPIYLALPYSLVGEMKGTVGHCVIGSRGMCRTAPESFTEKVSLKMVKDAGANFVVLDPNETAVLSTDSSLETHRSLKLLLEEGMQTFVVLGESSEAFHEGKTTEALKSQLEALLHEIPKGQLERLALVYASSWITLEGLLGLENNFEKSYQLFRHILEEVLGASAAKVRVLARIPHFHGSIYPYIQNTSYEGFYFPNLATQGRTLLETLNNSKHQ